MSRLIDANKCFDAIVQWAADEDCTPIAQGACKAAEIIASCPTVDAVPMSDDLELMLSSAVRYALGRRTYIVSTTCKFITCCLDKLSERTLICMKRDIEERRDMGDKYLGDECDRQDWNKLLDRINYRLKEMKE